MHSVHEWCIEIIHKFNIVAFSFEHFQAKFEFHHGDYEKQFLHAVGRKDKAGMVMNNPNQSVFLFMDRQHLQVGSIKHEVLRSIFKNVMRIISWFFFFCINIVHSSNTWL